MRQSGGIWLWKVGLLRFSGLMQWRVRTCVNLSSSCIFPEESFDRFRKLARFLKLGEKMKGKAEIAYMGLLEL